MGILRFILALAVVIAHSSYLYGFQLYGLGFTGPVVSVQTFYMLSGFYMALILSKKYTGKGSYKLFITNRFLKIYPAYWIILLLTIALSALPSFKHIFGFTVQDYIGNQNLLRPGTISFLVITNLILFGQDMVLFQGVNTNGQFYFTANFQETNPQLFTFMPLPQAWTLSLELMFYMIAPFFVKRKTYALIFIIFASLAMRSYIYFFAGLYHDPWTYRFFPTELAFFLAGMVSYRLYLMISVMSINKKMPILATIFVAFVTLGFQFIPGGFIKQWFYYGLIFFLMPLLFIFSKTNRLLDRYIGELSYPIYISHIFVMLLLSPFLNSISPSIHINLIVCVVTVVFSMLLVRFVLTSIENYRQDRVRKIAEALA
jgi:peptidoglycan/LPS O-acetylase OafA/YrhL